MNTCLTQEIPYQNPLDVFSIFEKDAGAIFLESAARDPILGRFSYIATEPFAVLRSKQNCVYLNDELHASDPFVLLRTLLEKYSQINFSNVGPLFQGGVAGYFGYELFQHLEKIPFAKTDDMQFPDLFLGFYDCVIAFDHVDKKAWIFSSGFPELDGALQVARAQMRLQYFYKKIISAEKNFASEKNPAIKVQEYFSKESYCSAVRDIIEYILAGDIFQANLSQRFHAKLDKNYNAFELYKRLRTINPACFASYFNFGKTKIISASPERFIKLENQMVETRPIKGTRKRGSSLEEDQQICNELVSSVKDNAENTMIVDLLRNDLSRVCLPGSIAVPQLCGLETFPTVHHLVSVVTGELKNTYSAIDLLQATFPGGSITGAPKIRAMEIISEVEPTVRGPYCGSVGYISWNGNMDTAITIRTICIQDDVASFQVGGAIVADSDPEAEYEETLLKGRALLQALQGEF